MKLKPSSFFSTLGVLLFVLSFISEFLFAQVYPSRTRSPFLDWKTLRSDSFVIYYPQGARGAAIQTAFILDDQLPILQGRYGSGLTRFPIILNPHNALSNGYVATFPYRSEIELPPLKGKVLNPASGGWLETVVPHELVHAVHYQIRPDGALTNIIGLFSPDLRRSIHGMVPVGLHEGIAVDHESHSVFSTPDLLYGRGSYPFFINRFEVALIEEPWSLGQLFQISGSTLPYDRHYLGGYAFMSWLRERVGEDVITSTIERHYKQPYLGYGWALKKETGLWPSSLYKEFSQQEKIKVNERLRSSASVEKKIWEDQLYRLSFSSSFTGIQWNRPLWVSENQLMAHGRFYNAPSGYYRIDLPAQPFTNKNKTQTTPLQRPLESRWALDPDLLIETISVSDYQTSFSADSSSILFSKLIPSVHFEQEWRAILSSVPLEDEPKGNRRIIRKKKQHAETLLKPQKQGFISSLLPKDESFVSLFGVTQNHSYTLALFDSLDVPIIVEISLKSSSGRNQPFVDEPYSDQGLQIDRIKKTHSEILPIQLQLKPGGSDTVAVIARVRGLQGLWITKKEEIYSHIQSNPPAVSFKNASILDVSWHPFNSKVLLTSDRNQVIQIYELDLVENHLHQLSFSDFNVFEPSYSPSGSQLAFVEQMNPEQLIGVVSLDSIKAVLIEKSEWVFSQNQASVYAFRPRIGLNEEPFIQKWEDLFISSPSYNDVPKKWDEGDYRAGFKWLKPRLWTPISNEITQSERNLGLFFASTDPLREQSLSSEITLFKDQLWWETNYVYSGFWPGFQITSQKSPSFQTFRFTTGPIDDPETTTFTKRLLLRERGVEVSLPFQWNLSPGLYKRSTFSIQPSIESTQALFFNENGSSSLSDKVRLTRIGLFISYQHLLHQNSRSIFPDRGGLLYFQTEKNSKTKTFELEVENRRYRTSFSEKAGIRLGGAVYFPIYPKYNQSGRFLMELISQTDIPVFSLESLTRNLITRNPLPGSNGGLFSEVRLVFPLKTVDDGGLTVPLYLNSIYLQTIHQTYLPYRNRLSNGFSISHAVFGSGVALRTRFRISNLTLDFGLGLFWDTQSKKGEVLIGVF